MVTTISLKLNKIEIDTMKAKCIYSVFLDIVEIFAHIAYPKSFQIRQQVAGPMTLRPTSKVIASAINEDLVLVFQKFIYLKGKTPCTLTLSGSGPKGTIFWTLRLCWIKATLT